MKKVFLLPLQNVKKKIHYGKILYWILQHMRIKPFKALRPRKELAEKIASVPYDVVDTEQAQNLVKDNPLSFLRVVRAEIDLTPDKRNNPGAIHARAADNLKSLIDQGALTKEKEQSVYVYRLTLNGHSQHGVVACCHVDDYENNLIKRHEKTREDKEKDRAAHISTLNAHSGPVFLTYRDNTGVDSIVETICSEAPLFDFQAVDGVRHTVWRVADTNKLVQAFGSVPEVYIADGHHRAASAWRVARERGNENGTDEHNWFLCVLFPAQQLRILPYNRCVTGIPKEKLSGLLQEVSSVFSVSPQTTGVPEAAGHIRMYLQGQWYDLTWKQETNDDPAEALDAGILQSRLLSPILGIENPRTDPRMDFIGGIHGVEILKERVDAGRADLAFSLWPVSVEQLMAVSDAGKLMPPKSTWFEPKLRSGLLVHTF